MNEVCFVIFVDDLEISQLRMFVNLLKCLCTVADWCRHVWGSCKVWLDIALVWYLESVRVPGYDKYHAFGVLLDHVEVEPVRLPLVPPLVGVVSTEEALSSGKKLGSKLLGRVVPHPGVALLVGDSQLNVLVCALVYR